MTTTYGTVAYYRARLSKWSDDHDQLGAALGMIEMAVDEEALLPESEKLAQVRNVLDALDQVRHGFDRNRAR